MKHTFRSIIDVVRQSPIGQMPAPEPPNRQLSRTETSMITEQVHGHLAERPTILGDPNGAPAIQVYATGLYEGVRKGQLRWVTGSGVKAGLRSGVIVEVAQVAPAERAVHDAIAEHNQAEARDHIPGPAGGMFDPVAPSPIGDLAPMPEVTDVDRRLADMSKSELVKVAQLVDLPGRSSMDKSELYEHLRHLPNVGEHLP